MEPLLSPQPPADYLSEAELAELTGRDDYHTAPEYASAGFNYYDEEAQAAQRAWRQLFKFSLWLLFGLTLASAMTGLGGWLHQKVSWMEPEAVHCLDLLGMFLSLLALALEVGLQVYWRQRLSPWVLARAHAERLRGGIWRYLLGLPQAALGPGGPRLAPAEAEADWHRLLHHLATIRPPKRRHPRPAPPNPSAEPVSRLQTWRQRLLALGPGERLRAYCTARLATQAAYFRKRAGEMQREARSWRVFSYALQVVAFLWGAERLFFLFRHNEVALQFLNFNLLLVAVGAVGLIRAYLDAEDLEPLAARYRHMAQELDDHRHACPHEPVLSAAFQHFVLEGERLLHDETADWSTRRGDLPPADAPA